MLNDERFDFSQESDLKDRLWEKMEQSLLKSAPTKQAVSLDSISPAKQQKIERQRDEAKPTKANPEKGRGVRG